MIIILIIGINIVSYLMMFNDKKKAKQREQRIPEALFFIISVLGGGIGILLGAIQFKHKTRKRSFQFKITIGTLIFLKALTSLI